MGYRCSSRAEKVRVKICFGFPCPLRGCRRGGTQSLERKTARAALDARSTRNGARTSGNIPAPPPMCATQPRAREKNDRNCGGEICGGGMRIVHTYFHRLCTIHSVHSNNAIYFPTPIFSTSKCPILYSIHSIYSSIRGARLLHVTRSTYPMPVWLMLHFFVLQDNRAISFDRIPPVLYSILHICLLYTSPSPRDRG